MSQKKTLGAKVSRETYADVEAYRARHGHETPSEATRELVEVGLREASAPLLYRAKHIAIDAAWHLSILAVVTILLGYATTAIEPGQSAAVAAVMLAVAVGAIAAVELARVARGRSQLDWRFWRGAE